MEYLCACFTTANKEGGWWQGKGRANGLTSGRALIVTGVSRSHRGGSVLPQCRSGGSGSGGSSGRSRQAAGFYRSCGEGGCRLRVASYGEGDRFFAAFSGQLGSVCVRRSGRVQQRSNRSLTTRRRRRAQPARALTGRRRRFGRRGSSLRLWKMSISCRCWTPTTTTA